MPRKKKSVAEQELATDQERPRRPVYKPKYTTNVETDAQEAVADDDGMVAAYAAFADAAAVEDPAPLPQPKVGKSKPFTAKKRASLQEFATEGDLIDIWERRILNPNHQESPAIRIKTPGMKIRWINLSQRGRFQRARFEQGWFPVHKSELVEEREIYGVSYTVEGYVCRGEKQSEMLMKIPLAIFKQILARQHELNKKSYEQLRTNMGSAGYTHMKDKYGGSVGDQAHEAAMNFKGDIKFGTEAISPDE